MLSEVDKVGYQFRDHPYKSLPHSYVDPWTFSTAYSTTGSKQGAPGEQVFTSGPPAIWHEHWSKSLYTMHKNHKPIHIYLKKKTGWKIGTCLFICAKQKLSSYKCGCVYKLGVAIWKWSKYWCFKGRNCISILLNTKLGAQDFDKYLMEGITNKINILPATWENIFPF